MLQVVAHKARHATHGAPLTNYSAVTTVAPLLSQHHTLLRAAALPGHLVLLLQQQAALPDLHGAARVHRAHVTQ